jgi:Iap family predicted aminopeptidase
MDEIESELLTQVSRETLWETNSKIAQWVRLSGSAEEHQAVEYLRGVLDTYGLRTTLLEHPALISYPLDTRLELIGPAGETLRTYACLGHAFSASVDALQAEVVDVGAGDVATLSTTNVRGKIVIIDGLATPLAVYEAERAGAAGMIFVNDDHLHNMIVSTIWGTPTPQSAERIPHTPAVSIVAADGRDLRARLAAGSRERAGAVNARLRTHICMDWQTTPILIGELDGQHSDEFVLFSGHQDSWHAGAMDNGSANATMLEVARLLATRKADLHRGLRVVFWSGHSHGRYSSSTWYVDNHWEELNERCVAHVNVDSTGARGATYYGSFQAHSELGAFGAAIVHEHTGQAAQPRRMSRAGDMSFNGAGIPALFMSLSQVPVTPDDGDGVTASFSRMIGGKMPWWWHTSEDTIDKVDLDVLALDTRVYVSTLWRLCHNVLLPMDFQPVIADLRAEIVALQQAADPHFDLSSALERTDRLASEVSRLAGLAGGQAAHPHEAAAVNRRFIALSRVLIPVTYTYAGRFDHDPAWAVPHLPGLQDIRRLAQMPEDSSAYHFLRTQLVRNYNALLFALRQALEICAAAATSQEALWSPR